MDWETYRENTLRNIGLFDRTFRALKKWQDIKLSDLSPCSTCEVYKELTSRQYEVQMSGGLQEEITEPCRSCIKAILWQMECIEKLSWYEENDERLNNKND